MSKRAIAGILILLAILSVPFALLWGERRPARGHRVANQVAVVYISGLITTQSGSELTGAGGIGEVMGYLTEFRGEPNVRAAVIRVDSGGGTAAASQEVHRAITKLREAGKPVVISMGEMATSGAYYLAVAADRIVANPSTITGSIGVISQFLNFSGFAEEHGFGYETVKSGPYKDLGNPTRPMTEDERAVLMELIDDSLDQFVGAVAEGRGLSEDEVRRIADGRIITGRQAYELGLIDEFGGLEEAIDLAADLAGIEGKPNVVHYVKRGNWLSRYLPLALADSLNLEQLLGRELMRLIVGGERRLTVRY